MFAKLPCLTMINVIEKNKNICKNRIREDLRSILLKAKYEAKKNLFLCLQNLPIFVTS